MNLPKKVYLPVIFVVVIGLSFFVGFRSAAVYGNPESSVAGVANLDGGKPDGVDFGAFWKAWNVLDQKFAGTTTSPEERVYGAIEGLTSSLGDPYTVFFPPEETKIFQSEITGNFEGVGMEVGVKDGKLVVVAPIKDSPAEKAGVKAGDFISKIDSTEALDMPSDKAVQLIRGKAGTSVTLTLLRQGVKNPIEVTIVRARIDLPTIKTEKKDELSSGTGLRKDGVFVISLYSFSANSANLFRNALKEFINSGSHKLVIDLRGNPGGYLEAAVDMASWFLPSGKIVVREVEGKDQQETDYRSKGYNIFTNKLRLIVLVDEGSASASEILAGALSENGVAKLVGEKTFGKGSVQELVSITPDTSLKVTVAKWLTPKGNWISKQGIKPDYVVSMSEKDVEAKRDPQMDKALELLSAMP